MSKKRWKKTKSKAKQEERCIAVELLWNAQYKREDREREKERQA